MTLLEARRYVVEDAPDPSTPFCWYCEEGVSYRPEDGPPDVAVVRYNGKWICGFHAAFHLGDLPAREFDRLEFMALLGVRP